MLTLFQKENKDPEEANIMGKTKILAISNDPTLRQILQQKINGGDYEVASTQHTGHALRDVLYRERPAFIILDIMMPNLDGIGTCLTLRQWTQAPIMMLSTWGTTNGMVRGLNLGSESYLTEPFGTDELKLRINETLRRNAAAMIDPIANIHFSTFQN
jgi:two-component system phosphate regulon response regulator OmpR